MRFNPDLSKRAVWPRSRHSEDGLYGGIIHQKTRANNPDRPSSDDRQELDGQIRVQDLDPEIRRTPRSTLNLQPSSTFQTSERESQELMRAHRHLFREVSSLRNLYVVNESCFAEPGCRKQARRPVAAC